MSNNATGQKKIKETNSKPESITAPAKGTPVGIPGPKGAGPPSRGALLMGIYRSYCLEFVSGRDVEHKPLIIIPRPLKPYRKPGVGKPKTYSKAIYIIDILT